MSQDYQEFNKNHPISLRNIQEIIANIHLRYPRLPKNQIALIVKWAFIVLRKALLDGETISISGLLNDCKLIMFKRGKYNVVQATNSTADCFKYPK